MLKRVNNFSKHLARSKKDLDKDVEDFYSLLASTQDEPRALDDLAPQESDQEEADVSLGQSDEMFFEKEYEGQLSVDIYQTNTEFVITSAIAGVRPEDIDVSVSNDMVTIRGRRQKNLAPKDADYLFSECYWGNFSRSIILPLEINTKKISARMENGILEVRLAKIKKEKSVTVKVIEN